MNKVVIIHDGIIGIFGNINVFLIYNNYYFKNEIIEINNNVETETTISEFISKYMLDSEMYVNDKIQLLKFIDDYHISLNVDKIYDLHYSDIFIEFKTIGVYNILDEMIEQYNKIDISNLTPNIKYSNIVIPGVYKINKQTGINYSIYGRNRPFNKINNLSKKEYNNMLNLVYHDTKLYEVDINTCAVQYLAKVIDYKFNKNPKILLSELYGWMDEYKKFYNFTLFNSDSMLNKQSEKFDFFREFNTFKLKLRADVPVLKTYYGRKVEVTEVNVVSTYYQNLETEINMTILQLFDELVNGNWNMVAYKYDSFIFKESIQLDMFCKLLDKLNIFYSKNILK